MIVHPIFIDLYRCKIFLVVITSDAEAAGSTKFPEAGSESNFEFLWKQEADAEAVLKVLLPLPFLPNIM